MMNKVNNDLKDTEYMIDKRIISSVLVSYFDVNSNSKTKQKKLSNLRKKFVKIFMKLLILLLLL